MGIFSKKKNNNFFEELEKKASAPAPFEIKHPQEEKRHPEHVLTTDEILTGSQSTPKESNVQPVADPLAEMRRKMLENVKGKQNDTPAKQESEPKQKKADSLYKRCLPYIVDDNGKDTTEPAAPLYKLQSVADILQSESENALKEISEKYGIDISKVNFGENKPKAKNTDNPAPQTAQKETPKPKETAPAPVSAVPDTSTTKRKRDDQIFEEILAGLNSNQPQEDLPAISDIDNNSSAPKKEETAEALGGTIKFTPIKGETGGERMSVSTVTKQLDLTGEFTELEAETDTTPADSHLEQTEFEEFSCEEELNSPADIKKLIRSLSIKKRTAFLQLGISILLTLVLTVFTLPIGGNFIITNVKTGMIVCTAILALAAAVNYDMFLHLPKFFSRRSSPDCLAVTATVSNVGLGVAAAILAENEYPLILMGAIILCFRALGKFFQASAKLGNLRQITVSRPKKAVALLTDKATTFSMAKNSVEGDALIAVPRSTETVGDFMKFSEYSTVLGGKMRIISTCALLLSICIAFVAGAYFRETIYGFFAAAVIQCIAACPLLFLIDALPVYGAAQRLNKKGAVINGIAGAEHLEMANAVVLSSRELFPDGMVTMQDMKVLSENNVDEIFLRAASLTEAINSPLTAIFKRIAGTNKSYTIPDSDSVKYEERMGISGWVDNELLFIGNRTLMEAHGISVPSVEFDRKILRRGYFPVYIANGNKACALVMAQYDVDANIAKELNRLTNLGVTLLVDNCDPNITDEMVCDYIGLYSDSVKIMSNSGSHMYRNAITPTEKCSAPAAFRGNPLNLISVINCASRVKKSNLWLTVFYILIAVLGAVAFAYISFAGSDIPPSGNTVMLCSLAATAVSFLLYIVNRP